MFASIKRFFGIVETDLGKIISGFDRTLKDLEHHMAYHDAAKDRCYTAAADARGEALVHAQAAQAASNIHNNLQKLLGK